MTQLIILFDGVCNLCNGFVQFIIKRDPKAKFKFAALQSDVAKQIISSNNINSEKLSSVIFIANNKIYTQSDAALKIAQHLGSAWVLTSIFFVIPKFIRNGVYCFIAKNRYRWFGEKNQCMVPTPELKSRFL
jgi:predicted DCC family thiol-disulfide oxidoreductase YuxK